jgi:anhydro-N-acetylmuramic acid kinase
METKLYKAIGLMSGTSMDGIDAAIVETDGCSIFKQGPYLTIPYKPEFRARLKRIVDDNNDNPKMIEEELTLHHVDAVKSLLQQASITSTEIDLLGFHGHTISHNPQKKTTCQIGDGKLLAQKTGINVINDFRSADVAAGGQGAPLAPIFHRILARDMNLPVIILNIGGVGNVTWIGNKIDELVGFDTGPGNALIDDWVSHRSHHLFDRGGQIASTGRIDATKLNLLMSHPFFGEAAPKSLDRDMFKIFADSILCGESFENGAALLTAFTISTILHAIKNLLKPFNLCIVVGGGRHNKAIMQGLNNGLSVDVISGDSIGWIGDAVEAQAFGFLAVRSRKRLPISFPGTTGAPFPISGGVYTKASPHNE